MRILVASPYLPWPPSEGGKISQCRTYEALRTSCRFTLVVPLRHAQEEEAAATFAGMFPEIQLRTVRLYRPPSPPPSVSFLRRVVRKLKSLAAGPAPVAAGKPAAPRSGPYYPFANLGPEFIAVIEEELAKGCDLFQAEFADMLTLGPLVGGRVPSVFIHHQLHFMYARRFLAEQGGGDSHGRYVSQRMEQEEAAYLRNFDSVVVFSETDRVLLEDFSPALRVRVSPFPSPEDPPAEATAIREPAQTFVFVASHSHRPNVDGLCWFMKEAWPKIRAAVPGARMEVVGAWSEAARQQVPNHGDIQFHGFVDDLAGALRSKIMVVPVWVGSGIRTKILAAWSSSSPVVTTTVGVEGLPGQPGKDYLVGDDAGTFADACIALARDPNRFNEIARNGLELVRGNYSLAAVREARLAIYAEAQKAGATVSASPKAPAPN